MESDKDQKESESLCSYKLKDRRASQHLGSTQVFSLAEAYEKSGGFGRFQLFILVLQIFAQIGPALLMSNLVYFEIKPTNYICTFRDGTVVPCGIEVVCNKQNTDLVHWEVDPNISYMKNLITDFGMHCESKVNIGLIGSMYFIGEAVGSLVYIIFASKLKATRVNHIVFKNFLIMIVLWCLMLLFRQLYMLYFSIFFVGLCQAIGIIQGYVYGMEMMPFDKRNLVSTGTGMVDKVLLTVTTLILKYYESNWVYIMIPGLLCSIIAFALSFFAVDSPQFHHDQGNYNKSREIFQTMCRWNKAKPLGNFVFEKEPINLENNLLKNYSSLQENNKNSENISDNVDASTRLESESSGSSGFLIKQNIFETKIEIYQFLLCILVFSTCILDDNILHYMLKTYDGDIYNNTLTLIFSGSISIYVSFQLINKFHPTIALTMSFLLLSTAGFFYPQIDRLRGFFTGAPTVTTSALILLFFAKLGAGSAHNLAYLFIIWQFNSKQNSFVFASCNLFARLVAVLAPVIGEFDMPIPMIVLAISSGACGLLCFMLYVKLEREPKIDQANLKDKINH